MVFSNNLLLGAVSAAASDYLIEQSLLVTVRLGLLVFGLSVGV